MCDRPPPHARRPVAQPLAALALLVLFGAGSAQAAGTLLLIEPPPEQTRLALGASVLRAPSAPGSARGDTRLLPGLDLALPNGFFMATDTGLGWNLAPALLGAEAGRDWQLGARLWPQTGRPRRDTPAGLPALATRVVPEAFANLQLGSVLLLQSGLSTRGGRRGDGTQLELGATSGLPLGDELLAITLAASRANAAQRRSSFGVSPAESAASGLPTFEPGAGWQDWSVAFSGEHRFSERWSLSGQWLRARLLGGLARSPLVHQRDSDQVLLSLWHGF